MFHLGWFVGSGYGIQSWKGTWSGVGEKEWMKPDLYIDMAKSLERAGFDYMMFEDGLLVPDTYGGSMRTYLKGPLEAPRNDPTALIGILGHHTSRIGLIPTMSTSFYPPFMAARMIATLDHLCDGRAGANLVTSSNHGAAKNFGMEMHYEHDMRYRMAGEWIDLVTQLLESWDEDALVYDKSEGIFADHTKVHHIDFEGEFFKSRGPLNTPPGPQRTPVICQAGGSPAGRDFAAAHADTIVCVPLGLEAMKEYRADISRRMIAHGRDPHDCKVLYLVNPVLADTQGAAEELYEMKWAQRQSDAFLEQALSTMSYFSGIDFSQFDLDEPMPDLTGKVNGHQSSMARYAKDGANKTLRELALGQDVVESIKLVGTPESVAETMGEAMDFVGGDGFLMANDIDRRSVASIADGLVPALRKRGLVRGEYEHEHFKDNLKAF
ncbi:NtaA/DmoA family FMN-dependent monooxygenase [Microbacterium aquimaris]|uniref:NtaA/DmoA family FMN-dependent monooxygenase n=1 Tax=Microbacterium aquimaris TaxID=459816 RepID=A0ABU5N5B5_9MICO|nr:NtaA/DmoA family FMN-dependent monooxygenase [Microbacterium aquimaris]MDZ8161271.1 NtaA/DmoA family FMN-dependent monooxygenase [Microbacterium aquimaris]